MANSRLRYLEWLCRKNGNENKGALYNTYMGLGMLALTFKL